MSDEERQDLKTGAEAAAADLSQTEDGPSMSSEALESRPEPIDDQPSSEEPGLTEPDVSVGAMATDVDPASEAPELETEAEDAEESPASEADEAEVPAELAEEEAEAEAEANAPEPVEEVTAAAAELDEAGMSPADEAVDAAAESDAEVDAEPASDEAPEAESDEEATEPEPEPEPAVTLDAADETEDEPESAEEQPAEVPDDDRLWYVIHCYSGQENKVRHNLEQRIDSMGMKDRIFDVVVPTEEEIEVKDGKRRTVERRVFPGYILVQMILSEDSWYVVRNTPGVTGFVGMGNEPTPLRPEEVSQIIKRMEAEAPRIKVTYKIGQKVRIIDGPFNDFIGTVDDIDMERAKVRVMVSFFGRETPVELDFLQVEKA